MSTVSRRENEAEIRAIAECISELDRRPVALRHAYRALSPLIEQLPETDALLVGDTALGAWRVLRDHAPDEYLVYLQAVRQRAGRHVSDLVISRIGQPRSSAPRELELLTPAQLCARAAPLQSVRGVLPSRGNGVAYGDSGSGKSFIALDLMFALARGVRWHGRRTRQGAGIWIGSEGSNKARVEAYVKHHGLQLSNLPIRFIEQPLALRGADSYLYGLLEKLQAAKEELGYVALVVVDTLNRSFGGGNESASEDMSQYVDAMTAIGAAVGGLVLVIHHAGKDSGRGARGHSSLRGAVDVELEVTRDPGGVRTLKVSKLRDGEDGVEFRFRLQVVDLGPHPDPAAEEGERWDSCVVVPSDEPAAVRPSSTRLPASARVALEALRTALSLHGESLPRTSTSPGATRAVRLEQWQSAYEAIRPIENGLPAADARRARQARRMAFQRAQDQLQASKIAGTVSGYWWLR